MSKKFLLLHLMRGTVGLTVAATSAGFLPPAMSDSITNCPDVREDPGNDPAKMSDAEVLNQWCVRIHTPISLKWQQTTKWKGKGKTLSCLLKVEPTGNISDVQIFKSSGSSSVDKAAIDAIKAATPFDRPLKALPAPQEIVVQFYKSGDMRTKLKKGDELTSIGAFVNFGEPE